MRAHNVLIAVGAAAAIIGGLAVLQPEQPLEKSCRLLDIAFQEAQMAEAWYIETGRVLVLCGVADAEAEAARKACYARRRDDTSVECEQ